MRVTTICNLPFPPSMKHNEKDDVDLHRKHYSPDDIRRLYHEYCANESRKSFETTEDDPWGKPLPTNNATLNERAYVIASHGEIGYMSSLIKRRNLIVDILCETDEAKRNQILEEAKSVTQKVIIEYGELNRLATENNLTDLWKEERKILENAGIPTLLIDCVLNPAGGLRADLVKFPDVYCITTKPIQAESKNIPPLSEYLRGRFGKWFNQRAA